jgi:hypothetical protein
MSFKAIDRQTLEFSQPWIAEQRSECEHLVKSRKTHYDRDRLGGQLSTPTNVEFLINRFGKSAPSNGAFLVSQQTLLCIQRMTPLCSEVIAEPRSKKLIHSPRTKKVKSIVRS